MTDLERRVEELERKVRSLERSFSSIQEDERMEQRRAQASRRMNLFFRILVYTLFFAALIAMMMYAQGKFNF